MNRLSSSQGFTRKELLATLALSCLLVFCIVASLGSSPGSYFIGAGSKVLTASKTARDIHNVLSAWAADNNGEFPKAQQYSNEALRELFKANLVDTEKLFWIPGDAWHKNSPSGDGKRPDGEIGTAPDFAQALTTGECAWAYVTGLNQKSDPQLPLLANGFTESLGVYKADKTRRGGVFRGEKCA